MQSASETRYTIPICVLLGALTLAAFLPVLGNGFVNYDDTAYVTENPQVLAGLTPAGVAWAFREAHFANWHPLTWLSHMLDVQVFGLQAGGHHLTSLLLHVANTILLFLLLRRMTARTWPSAVVAALFALHPLHVESVAWVSDRKDVLGTFFALICLWAYVRYTEARKNQNGPGRVSIFYIAALVFFTLGLMSKAVVVTVAGVMLLVDYWPLQRLRLDSEGLKLKHLASLCLEKIPFVVLGIIGTALAILFLKRWGATGDAPNVWMGERLARMVASYQHYLGEMFWPTGLIIPFLRPTQWPPWLIPAAATTVIGLTLLALWLGRRCPYLPVGWFWFIGTLVPVVGTVPVGAHLFADRYTYFPLIGLFIAVVWSASEISAGWRNRTAMLASVTGALLLACMVATNAQVRHWRDSEQLYRHTLAVMPGNYMAHNGLGLHLVTQHRLDEAIAEYRAALGINPLYDDAYSNLGRALAEQGRYPEAAESLEAALRIRPNDIKTLNNFGNVLILQGKFAEAAQQFGEVLRLQPNHFNAHNNLAVCSKKLGRTDQAIAEYREALRLQPAFLEAMNNLASILAADPDSHFRNGAEAVDIATRACELTHYQNPTLLATLAAAYAEAGRFQEAISFAQQAEAMAGNQPALKKRVATMLESIQVGKPYREN